jgi:hypothetical protein
MSVSHREFTKLNSSRMGYGLFMRVIVIAASPDAGRVWTGDDSCGLFEIAWTTADPWRFETAISVRRS